MIKNEKLSKLKMKDLTGFKIGRLTVLNVSNKRNKNNRLMWDCVCDCDNKVTVLGDLLNKSLRGGIGTKSCGCLRSNVHNKIKNREKALWRKLYNSSTLKKDNYRIKKGWDESDITFEYFKSICSSACAYCGVISSNEIKDKASDKTLMYNGLDRVDSDKGYLKDNVVSCCKHCNMAKSNMSVEDFLHWVNRVYNYNFK